MTDLVKWLAILVAILIVTQGVGGFMDKVTALEEAREPVCLVTTGGGRVTFRVSPEECERIHTGGQVD